MLPVSHSTTNGSVDEFGKVRWQSKAPGVDPAATVTAGGSTLATFLATFFLKLFSSSQFRFTSASVNPVLIGFTPLPSPRFLPDSGKIVNLPLPTGHLTAATAARMSSSARANSGEEV